MRKTLLTTASAVALLFAGTAFATDRAAETTASPETSVQAEASASAAGSDATYRSYQADSAAFQGTVANDLLADELIGANVIDANSDNVGEVSDLLLGTDGNINHVLVDVGGFLGIGSRTVALELSDLAPAPDGDNEMRTSMTDEQLRALPELREEDGTYRTVAADDGARGDTARDMAAERPAAAATDERPAAGQMARGQGVGSGEVVDRADRPTPDHARAGDDRMPAAAQPFTDYRSYEQDREAFTGSAMDGRSVDDLMGANIVDPAGDRVGRINDLLIGQDGNVDGVIVNVGGFLGMGARSVAIDLDQIRPAEGSGDDLVANVTKEQLEAMPRMEREHSVWREEQERPGATPATPATPAEPANR